MLTAEEIAELAKKNSPMPSGLTLSQHFLFAVMRNVYESYRKGIISAEQGKYEKLSVIREYEKIQQWEMAYKRQSRMSVELGKLMIQANKDGCEVCRKMSEIIDGRIVLNE